MVCFFLDTPERDVQNPPNFPAAKAEECGGTVQYLPGWTVQCINPECPARGMWLRADPEHSELCSNCSAPLRNVPPPLGPRLRLRPRPLATYRPRGRPR